MELFFLVKASSSEELNIKTKQLSQHLLGKGLKTFVEGQNPSKGKSGLGVIFSDLIPGVRSKFLRRHLDKTSHLIFLLCLSKSYLMNDGVIFHDNQDEEIFFNPFLPDLKNKNMLVTGTSGAGKSVFVNKLVHHLIEDHPTVILDKGGSFKRLSLYHGGKVLSKGFNPFQFKDPFYLREIILSVVDKEKFGKLEKGQLLKSIKEGIKESKSFHDLLNFLEKDFPSISSYFEDIREFLTDSVLDFKPILYVDVENYPKTIISPLIIFMLEYFKTLPAKEKILVFDECWSFLKDHSAYIDECFRTFRKSGGFPIAISQSIKDFENIGSDLFQSITNNSFFKVYFPQEIKTDGDMDIFDKEKVDSLCFEKGIYSDCYLKTSDNRYRKTIRNYLSPLELELFNTEAGGEKKMMDFIHSFGKYFDSTKTAIEAFVNLKKGGKLDDFNFISSH